MYNCCPPLLLFFVPRSSMSLHQHFFSPIRDTVTSSAYNLSPSLFSAQALFPFGWTIVAVTMADVSSTPERPRLLDWYAEHSVDVRDFLHFEQLGPPIAHSCGSSGGSSWDVDQCVTATSGGHLWLHRHCPESGLVPTSHIQGGFTLAHKKASPQWRKQHLLDGVNHTYRANGTKLRDGVMDKVLCGTASRSELWHLEGELVRLILTAGSASDVEASALLWACVYRARRGYHVPSHFFGMLYQAIFYRPLHPHDSLLLHRYDAFYYPESLEHAWERFASTLSDLRIWSHLPNVVEGIVPSLKSPPYNGAHEGIPAGQNGMVAMLTRRWMKSDALSDTGLADLHYDWMTADVMVRYYVKQELLRKGEVDKVTAMFM